MAAKQLERLAKKCEKDEKTEKVAGRGSELGVCAAAWLTPGAGSRAS